MTSALKCGWVVSTTSLPLYPHGKTRYALYRRLGGPKGRSGRVRKISALPTGIRSPDRPVLSESLYRLSYPGPKNSKHKERKSFLHPTEFVSTDDIVIYNFCTIHGKITSEGQDVTYGLKIGCTSNFKIHE
jgi:hypothetical protein